VQLSLIFIYITAFMKGVYPAENPFTIYYYYYYCQMWWCTIWESSKH